MVHKQEHNPSWVDEIEVISNEGVSSPPRATRHTNKENRKSPLEGIDNVIQTYPERSAKNE
jgi:hypothetical protein